LGGLVNVLVDRDHDWGSSPKKMIDMTLSLMLALHVQHR